MLIAAAGGPVGPGSVVYKDLAVILQDSANAVDTMVSSPKRIEPAKVSVPFALQVKRLLKNFLAVLGDAPPVEHAEEYVFDLGGLSVPVHCLVLVCGDHVVALGLEDTAPEKLRQALRSRFPGYAIQTIPNRSVTQK
jgi:hypothetical protein